MNTVIEILHQIMPIGYFVVFALLLYVIRFYYTRFVPIEKKVDKLEENFDKLSKDVGEIKNLITKDLFDVKAETGAVKAFLISKYKLQVDIFSMKKSPRQLNPTGQKLFEDAKCEEFLKTNKDYLFAELDKYNPLTALDVETYANVVCNEASSSPMFNELKNFVYNYPSIKAKDKQGREINYDVTLPDICFVLSLPLRDMYLNAHPNLKA